MKAEKRERMFLLSGVLVLLFLVVAFQIVWRAEPMEEENAYGESLFQTNQVSEINISIEEAEWQDMLENPLEEAYHRASVTINGETIGNVAIRTKGNTSLTSVANMDSDRYSFKLDFNYYEEGGNYDGLQKLCLNNNYADPSGMREYISYQILAEMGIPTPRCNYTHITINGEEWGLYLAVEAVDEVFLQTHFADANGDLYKPEGMGGVGADLIYQGDDISVYTGLHPKTNENGDGEAILALMRALESGEGLEKVLDVEETLKYLAVNVALGNYDSYLGGTTHNYYLYEENGVFSILPWDWNLSFGGFGGGKIDIYHPTDMDMGGGRGPNATGEKEGEIPQEEMQTAEGEMPQLPFAKDEQNGRAGGMPFGNSQGKPLVDTLLAQDAFLEKYETYLRELAENYLTEEYMGALVQQTHDLIAPYIQKDETAFYTYAEFEEATTVDPEDTNSLVYFAVNMAESILTQMEGGEPTFDTSSFTSGGMGGGGAFQARTEKETKEGEKNERLMGQIADMGEIQQNAAEERKPPAEQGEEGQAMSEGMPPQMGELPQGMKGGGRQETAWKEILPTVLLCGCIFLVGAVWLYGFRRKKTLPLQKEKEKKDDAEIL